MLVFIIKMYWLIDQGLIEAEKVNRYENDDGNNGVKRARNRSEWKAYNMVKKYLTKNLDLTLSDLWSCLREWIE